ncbi:hypothetical protein [Methylocella silvestris]|uniref:hypothetical protein n=1 Tax=Methylocella silvestris TaxID=199596 RepID=UPI001FDF60A2|nr:hypothetical protein [Methylocella silvestris]
MSTILIILMLVLLLGGGGYFGQRMYGGAGLRRRRFGVGHHNRSLAGRRLEYRLIGASKDRRRDSARRPSSIGFSHGPGAVGKSMDRFRLTKAQTSGG